MNGQQIALCRNFNSEGNLLSIRTNLIGHYIWRETV